MSNKQHFQRLVSEYNEQSLGGKIFSISAFCVISFMLFTGAVLLAGWPLLLWEKLPASWQPNSLIPLKIITFIMSVISLLIFSHIMVSFFFNRGSGEKKRILSRIDTSTKYRDELRLIQNKIEGAGFCFATQRKISRTELEIMKVHDLIHKQNTQGGNQ